MFGGKPLSGVEAGGVLFLRAQKGLKVGVVLFEDTPFGGWPHDFTMIKVSVAVFLRLPLSEWSQGGSKKDVRPADKVSQTSSGASFPRHLFWEGADSLVQPPRCITGLGVYQFQ